MDYSNFDGNVCRICLQDNIIINWNDEIEEFSGVSYKDCYYKYTGLEESDCFPTNLCEICANDLKNAHTLFEKALKSFSVLHIAFTSNKLKTEYSDEYNNELTELEIRTFAENMSIEADEDNSSTVYNAWIELEEQISTSNICDDNKLGEEWNTVNAEEIPVGEDGAIEPIHFIDMHNFNSSAEEDLVESCDTDVKSETRTAIRPKKYKLIHDTMIPLSEICEADLPILSTKKGSESHQNVNANCKVTSTNNLAGKARKKNPLMCAYCSLWVDGNTHLKLHEATHSEDRKRTETCPQCGIKLYTRLALTEHMKIHDENRQKRHKCEFCEKAFFNRGALNVHRRIHLGLMVKCPICSKEFYRQVDLNRHLPKHSATPSQKTSKQLKYTVQCQYCNEYVPTNKWKGHKAAHLDQPQVKCKLCDKNFFARSKCVRHLQRFHKKKKGYEEFIYYYVNYSTRMSHLMLQQQEIVKPLE